MPKYDLKCTVKRGGEELTGAGVELPKETGDRLVKRKLAALSAGQAAAKQEAKGGGKAKKSGQDDPERYIAKHKGGGHYNVIDTETGEEVLDDAVSKDEAEAKAAALNADAGGQGEE